MRVLVACEFSGTVRDAFSRKGHYAVSCDLLPSKTEGMHRQCNVLDLLTIEWDLMIAHPPCTYLTWAAAWAFKDGPYHQKLKPETLVGADRRAAREEAMKFVMALINAPIAKICIENPRSFISNAYKPADQTIHPHKFGHDASKATCLWLKNLPKLLNTKTIQPRLVNGLPRWANQTDNGQNRISPSENRWAERSVTYQGIADAMADQWG